MIAGLTLKLPSFKKRPIEQMTLFLRVLALATLALLIGSYLGFFHGLGDSLAVIRFPLAAFGIFLWIAARRVKSAQALGTFSVLIFGLMIADRLRVTGPDGNYAIYQKNLWVNNQTLQDVASDIRAENVDFVTLQEVGRDNVKILEMLKDDYPFSHHCPVQGWSGIAVASKYPINTDESFCSDWRAFAAASIDTPDGPVWVVSLHLFWPYPRWQRQQLLRVLPKLNALDAPVVLGGDFNMQPGTRVEKAVSESIGAQALRPVFPTLFVRGRIPVSIDQIMAHCGTVDRRPKFGSDHHGLVARVGFSTDTCRE